MSYIKGPNHMNTNASGYLDPTAYKAIKNVEEPGMDGFKQTDGLDDLRYKKMIGLILRACELAGYEPVERIVLKDKYTGKVYR